MNDTASLFSLWSKQAVLDSDLIKELDCVKGKDDEIFDRFYKNLEFGTAGIRGIIGAGTNRMNVYTVGQATQGLADYLNAEFDSPSIAIAYDSRNKSSVFAREAAGVLAANNIKVYFFPELVPTPMLSFAVRRLSCSSGIIITASHNPAQYNGYKCYDPNGYQMTDEAAEKTYGYIRRVDMFTGIKRLDFDDALAEDMIDYVEKWLFDEFYEAVLERGINRDAGKKAGLRVIYTPLNGTGNKPVRHILRSMGIKDVTVVPEQEKPDGDFPTCPFPNPEIRQAFEKALELSKNEPADILLATDPDCDRVGIAARTDEGYVLMSGNEVGAMLTEYCLSELKKNGKLPENPVILKSLVTTPLIDAIAKEYGASLHNLLTGFKYIGEFITKLEEKGEEDRFVLGMEESYGYLSGTHARDKDAVVASMLICEMASYLKLRGVSVYEYMQSIYEKYGFYINRLDNFSFPGAQGMDKMSGIMTALRNNPPASVCGDAVVCVTDYEAGTVKYGDGRVDETGLPSSNVLSYFLANGDTAVVRPSGTEPKLKLYITAKENSRAEAEKKIDAISGDFKKLMGIGD